MRRKLAAGLALAALLALPAAAGGDVAGRKESVDAKLSRLHARIAAAQQRESALGAQIQSVSARIHGLESRVGSVSARLVTLENDLALHRERLNRLNELFVLETRRLEFLRGEYALALGRLNARLVAVYEGADPSALEVLLAARSFSDLLDELDYVRAVHRQDERITDEVGQARDSAHRLREQTRRVRAVAAAETRTVAVRTAQVREVRDQLLASRRELAAERSSKSVSLAHVRASERQDVSEAGALAAVSAQLAAQIQAAQAAAATAHPAFSSSGGAPSASGFIWPVNGPVTSPFGMRWGRMHTGIDIGVGYGTPIHAAASGTVIFAGVESGYGNLVFVDHGGGISTGYAHQSSIAVSNGQSVTQGQLIGYVGCTGHCFGPHLHFEVRVNGIPVDPLGYL